MVTYLCAEELVAKGQQSAQSGTRPTQSQSRRRGRKTTENKAASSTTAASTQTKYGSGPSMVRLSSV